VATDDAERMPGGPAGRVKRGRRFRAVVAVALATGVAIALWRALAPSSGLDRGQLERRWDAAVRRESRREEYGDRLRYFLWPSDKEIAAFRLRGDDPDGEVANTLGMIREALSEEAVPDAVIYSATVLLLDDWHYGSDYIACSFETDGRLFRALRGRAVTITILPQGDVRLTRSPPRLVTETCKRWSAVSPEDKDRLYASGAPVFRGSKLVRGHLRLKDERPWEQFNNAWVGASFATDGRAVAVCLPIESVRKTRGVGEFTARFPFGKVMHVTEDYMDPYEHDPPEPLEWF